MKLVSTILVACILSVGCSNPTNAPAKSSSSAVDLDKLAQQARTRITRTILILTPQGIDPNMDTVSFNSTVEKLTQAFSAKLQAEMREIGKEPVNVLDQSPKLKNGDKLALYANKINADAAIVLTIETPRGKDGFSIYLKAQYFDLVYLEENNKPKSVIPFNEISRSYCCKGPHCDNSLTITEVVTDFMQALKSGGRV